MPNGLNTGLIKDCENQAFANS